MTVTFVWRLQSVRTENTCKSAAQQTQRKETFVCCWSLSETLECVREGYFFCFLHFNTNLSCCELSRHKFVFKNRNKVFLFNSQCFPSNLSRFELLIYNPENILYIRSPTWQQHSGIFKSDKSSINRISGWFEVQHLSLRWQIPPAKSSTVKSILRKKEEKEKTRKHCKAPVVKTAFTAGLWSDFRTEKSLF